MLVKQKSFIVGRVEGHSGSVSQNYGCDRGKKTKLPGNEEVDFQVFPKNRGTVSYLEGKKSFKKSGG